MLKHHNLFTLNGQVVFEFAMLAACVVAALLTIRIYTKRAMEGRLREVSDQIGEHYSSKYDRRTDTTEVYSNTTVTPTLLWLRSANNSFIMEVEDNLPVYGVTRSITTTENTVKSQEDKLDPYEATLYN